MTGRPSHSFIELYNQTGNEIDLSGWYVACRSSEDGKDAGWSLLELTGKIEAGGYYLIRCGETGGTDYSVPAGDQEWDMLLHNKGISVAVFSRQAFAG